MTKKDNDSDWKYIGWDEVAPNAFKAVAVRKVSLDVCEATYDSATAIITFTPKGVSSPTAAVSLEPGSRQAALADVLISRYGVGEYVSWDELFEAIDAGGDSAGDVKKQQRMIMDLAKGINENVCKQFFTGDDFVIRKNLNLARRC